MKALFATNHHFHLAKAVLAHPSMTSAIAVGTIPLNGSSLLENLTRDSPHCLIVLGSPLDEDVTAVLAFIVKEMPDVRVVILPVTLEHEFAHGWKADLVKGLKGVWPLYTCHVPVEGQRLVFLDPDFDHLTTKEKLRTPRKLMEFEQHLPDEERRLKDLLVGARNRHAEAKRYFSAIEPHFDRFDREISYRMAHGSFKALSWARDLATRQLAVLAHYLPAAALPHFPRPAGMHGRLEAVHLTMPPEGILVIRNLVGFGLYPPITHLLLRLASAEFTGQSNGILLQESAFMVGAVQFTRQAVMAHLSVMDHLLGERIDLVAAAAAEHRFHRRLKLFRDFWALDHVMADVDRFQFTVRSILASDDRAPASNFYPVSFAQVLSYRKEEQDRSDG
jgi:hypothetical protein